MTVTPLELSNLEILAARRCTQRRAHEWIDVAPTIGVEFQQNEKQKTADEQKLKMDAVMYSIWTNKDSFLNRAKNTPRPKRMIQRLRSSTQQKWRDARHEAYEFLKTNYVFDYKAALKSCSDGNIGAVDICIAEQAGAHTKTRDLEQINPKTVSRFTHSVDQILKLQWVKSSKQKQVYRLPWLQIASSMQEMELWAFEFKKVQDECKATAVDDTWELIDRAAKELDIGEMKDGQCVEKEGMNCPEGHVLTKRRFNQQRASIVGGVAFIGGKFAVSGGMALVAAPMGPQASAAAFAAGWVMPITAMIAPGVGIVAGFVGKVTCTCLPRFCEYDKDTESCQMSGYLKKQSALNPYAGKKMRSSNPYAKLTYPGQKCVKKWDSKAADKKSKDQCVMETCSAPDFEDNTTSPEVFGSVGTKKGEIYNCLSRDGKTSGSLNLAQELPTGEENVVATRIEYYKALEFEHQPDDASLSPLSPDVEDDETKDEDDVDEDAAITATATTEDP